jgi:hypothetical protein
MRLLASQPTPINFGGPMIFCWGLLHNGTVHQLFIDYKKACDSVRRELLYNILIEFGIPRKLVGLIKMCLKEIYSIIHIGKNLS